VNMPSRTFRKNMIAGFYNQRFKPSHGRDNVYYAHQSNINPNLNEPNQTQRDPTKFEYSHNLFRNDYWEWRMRAADYLYTVGSNLHRSNDGWSRTLAAYSGFTFMMCSQALIWKIHCAVSTLALLTRIRDKGVEPTVDEVNVLDQVFQNEKLSQLFSPETYHVMDFDQEWEAGRDNAYFPEYRTPVAKYFNADMNTTVGKYKFGDLESGATMTLNFKTMPFSNNRYNFTEPFLIYDMWAEVSHNGEFFTEHLVKAEDTFKTKRIFVVWH